MGRRYEFFKVRLNAVERKELDALAEKMRCPKSQVIRRLLMGAHRHLLEDKPRCADGSGCLVPHLHTQGPRPAA